MLSAKLARCSCAVFSASLLVSLTGCGGDSNEEERVWEPGVFLDAELFADRCENPALGTDLLGDPVPDLQGSYVDENKFLRSWSNKTYLWYDEIYDRDPESYDTPTYFAILKSDGITDSGAPKDQFHFSIPTDEWILQVESGIGFGYGATWFFIQQETPREVVIAFTEPGSPAEDAGLNRGDRVLEVDGVDLVSDKTEAGIDALNAGLYPQTTDEIHTFLVEDSGGGGLRSVTMISGDVAISTVPRVSTIPTASGDVGYLLFNDHFAVAENDLVPAFEELMDAGVTDLVLDLRYNSGGLLAIASQVAYMIAGHAVTHDRIFETTVFNDKHRLTNPITDEPITPFPFINETIGFDALSPGEPLPSLDLSRVFILTGSATCSASESIMNSLRGVDIEVIQIGSTTCGKPYGFYPRPNCGDTYFTIQFKGENDRGFGDYAEGFSPYNSIDFGVKLPGCSVPDDFSEPLGSEVEARFAAALQYRNTGTCPNPISVSSSSQQKVHPNQGVTTDGVMNKSIWQSNRIMKF